MDAFTEKTAGETRSCPFAPPSVPLDVVGTDAIGTDDLLVLPMHKSMVVQYSTDRSGAPELHLSYGGKEISFDEPELFGFGETLAKQSQFRAGAATAWGPGYAWTQVQELLAQLIAQGILERADEHAASEAPADSRARPSPLPPAASPTPRTWRECETITRELAGRPVELGYLELIVPIFRVAHVAMDADGRQVGEANVFPRALRLDVPTEWLTCIYPGTRYKVDRPMNVTALKSMRAHWGQMMATLHRIRSAFFRRFPQAAQGWTVGHLERLATLVLAVPSYQLMRCDRPLENGALHPALSSLFRVTDGLRMTMHQMLFVPFGEPTLSPHAPMTSQQILSYAERNYSFHSETGVCAGPRNMVQEFLGVAGRRPRFRQVRILRLRSGRRGGAERHRGGLRLRALRLAGLRRDLLALAGHDQSLRAAGGHHRSRGARRRGRLFGAAQAHARPSRRLEDQHLSGDGGLARRSRAGLRRHV
jgi:hypothetical protein